MLPRTTGAEGPGGVRGTGPAGTGSRLAMELYVSNKIVGMYVN